MSTEGNQLDSLVHLRREVVGQIRFDPSEGLKDRLNDLFIPARRELGRKSLFLSSQYRLIATQLPGGAIQGEQGQKAERIQRALRRGNDRPNPLGKYMRHASSMRSYGELFALQFAVHLDPQIIAAIANDELLSDQAIIPDRERNIKAILVYDAAHILEGKKRDMAVRAIGSYVTGQDILFEDGGDGQQKSPNSQAYTTKLRFTFSPPHHHV